MVRRRVLEVQKLAQRDRALPLRIRQSKSHDQVRRRSLDCKYPPVTIISIISSPSCAYLHRLCQNYILEIVSTDLCRSADGSIDRATNDGKKITSFAIPAPITAGHKLGPKANTGAINAGLRALDRSGKPCRKWARKGFELKSFTGIAWGVGSWIAPQRDTSAFNGDVKSDSSSTGDVKQIMESSAMPSEPSSSDVAANQPNGTASSPAPIAA